MVAGLCCLENRPRSLPRRWEPENRIDLPDSVALVRHRCATLSIASSSTSFLPSSRWCHYRHPHLEFSKLHYFFDRAELLLGTAFLPFLFFFHRSRPRTIPAQVLDDSQLTRSSVSDRSKPLSNPSSRDFARGNERSRVEYHFFLFGPSFSSQRSFQC